MDKKIFESLHNREINWSYLFKETVLFVVLCYFFLVASTHNGLVNSRIQLISVILLSVMVIMGKIFKLGTRSGFEIPLYIFLGLFALSSFLSIDPSRSFNEFGLVLVECFILMFTISLAQKGWEAELIIKVVMIIGMIFMIFSFFEAGKWYHMWLSNQNVLGVDYAFLPAL